MQFQKAWGICSLLFILVTPSPFHHPIETPLPTLTTANRSYIPIELKRQITTELLTCGYLDGDPSKSRTANSGFNCRIDTEHGLWGFCSTTVIQATNCGLAGNCIDSSSCSSGCGITGTSGITTFTCDTNSFCSTALLTFGVDQTYSYIACGASATTDHLLATPTSSITTSQTSSSTVSKSSVSSSGSALPGSSDTISQPTQATTNNTPAIIGGVLGGVALVACTILGSIYLLRRNRQEKSDLAALDQAPPSCPPSYQPPEHEVEPKVASTTPPVELPTSGSPAELPDH